MTRQTEALLMIGPKSIAPWGDRAWRVGLSAQLVVGGSSPYWLVTPTDPPTKQVRPRDLTVELPTDEHLITSIIMLLALHSGDHQVERCLIESHNITIEDGIRVVAPYWELAPDILAYLTELLSSKVRLGLTLLDEPQIFSEGVVSALRSAGFDLDVFALVDPSPHRELDVRD